MEKIQQEKLSKRKMIKNQKKWLAVILGYLGLPVEVIRLLCYK